MDVFDGSDPHEESQATQLLQELLESNSSPMKNPGGKHSSALRTQTVHHNEVSSDSLPSSRTSNSLPHYHFHGLASTQTQSQQQEGAEETNQGSQKENIGASKPSQEHGRVNPPVVSRPSSPVASSSRAIATKTTQMAQRRESTQVKPKSPTRTGATATRSKPVTRQSPYKPTLQPSRYKPAIRRSSSQDSFAQDPENDEELFMAKAEQFIVPLSELKKGVSSSRNPGNATGGTSSMFSEPSGRVLVEATPSQSESSQNQDLYEVNQHYVETQIVAELEHMDSRVSDREDSFGGSDSEPTSSYRRFLRGEHDPEPLEATQPSTQPTDFRIPAFSHEQSPFVSANSPFGLNPSNAESHAVGASTSNAPQSGPRSLLNLVNPDLRYRYKAFEKVTPLAHATGQTLAGPSNTKPQHYNQQLVGESAKNNVQESFPAERAEFPLKRPARTGKSDRPPSPNTRNHPVEQSSGSSPVPMDIIPDSEPLRGQSEVPNVLATRDDVIMQPPPNQTVKTTVPDLEDEEDDIPLAATVAKRPRGRPPKNPGNKGKGVARSGLDTIAEQVPPVAIKEKKGRSRAAPGQKKVTGGSWETGVVPSSVPDQDEPLADVNHPNNNADSKKAVVTQRKPSNSRQGSRSTSAAPRSNLGQRRAGRDPDVGPVLNKKADEDEGTELAEEEEYLDDPEDGQAQNRKRKRGVQAKTATTGKTTRGTTKRAKREAATPGTQQSMRLRGTASTTAMNSLGSRVFALWKQDGHYYPGIVHAVAPNSCYTIAFDDGTTGDVNAQQMRLCELKIGDDVLFPGRTRPTQIIGIDEDNTDGTVQVKVDDIVKDIPVRDLRIANKTILYDWADRILSPEAIITTVKPARSKLSPSPSKLSVISVPALHGTRKQVLADTGLIITLSATNRSWEREKETVMSSVKNSGGFVIDDLTTILRMDGTHRQNNNRWLIKKEDVKWIGDQEIRRLFLLADEANQKPKFLIALALGIPCLSTSWLEESVKAGEEKDWAAYMLPQGFSHSLNARPSQQIDVDWGNSVHQLKDILSNTVPSKLFANKSILCVGPEMVLQPKGKRRATADDKALEATNAIPQIILCMGADCVEAVTEPRYANKSLKDYDYLVIREPSSYQPQFSNCVTVHWAWVKECLIASRYLPLPTWSEEDSQEA